MQYQLATTLKYSDPLTATTEISFDLLIQLLGCVASLFPSLKYANKLHKPHNLSYVTIAFLRTSHTNIRYPLNMFEFRLLKTAYVSSLQVHYIKII